MKGPPPEVDGDRGTLKARVPVQPGHTYSIRARLGNAWGSVSLSDPVLVRYLRPPRVSFPQDRPLETDRPFIDLSATVRSSVPLQTVEANVQGQGEVNPRDIVPEKPEPGTGANTWTVRLRQVPLREGHNLVRLWAINTEARSLEPGQVVVIHRKPLLPPVVDLIDPRQEMAVGTRTYEVRFRVRSPGPLRRLELVRGKESLKRFDLGMPRDRKVVRSPRW